MDLAAMKVAVYYHQPHATPQLTAFADGLRQHGIEPACRNLGARDAMVDADLAVCWGARHEELFERQRAAGSHFLILERGYVGDRLTWTSARFDGLNGRGWTPPAPDGGERWREYFADLMQPWRLPCEGKHVLLAGQVRGDAACRGVDLPAWYAEVAREAPGLWAWPLRFRPHPHPAAINDRVRGVPVLEGDLADALAGAALHVAWNSNTGVDAVMAGVPTVALDPGSMAWPVAAHSLDGMVVPDRAAWGRDLAWSQWQLEELVSGAAWDFLHPTSLRV